MDKLVNLLDVSGNDKQLGFLFGNGNGLLGNLWNLITKRYKRQKLKSFFKKKSNLLLHAASIGASIAALSTAISVGSVAAHTAHNHNHQVVLNDDFVLEPVFHRSDHGGDTGYSPPPPLHYAPPKFSLDTLRRITNRKLNIANRQSSPSSASKQTESTLHLLLLPLNSFLLHPEKTVVHILTEAPTNFIISNICLIL